jgi:hypothetical protein
LLYETAGSGKRRNGNAPPKQAQRLIEEGREVLIEPGRERRLGRVLLQPFAGRRKKSLISRGSALSICASEAQSFTYSSAQRDADTVGNGDDLGSRDPVKAEETGDGTRKRSFQHSGTTLAAAIFRSICFRVSARSSIK